jgi:hypothetical protein
VEERERTGIIGQEMPALPGCNEALSELHYSAEYRVELKKLAGTPGSKPLLRGSGEGGIRTHEAG